MTIVISESVSALGNIKMAFVPTLAAPAVPTAVEANGASAVKVDTFMMPEWEGMTGDQARGSRRRFAEKVGREALGTLTRALGDIMYAYLPQQNSAHAANKMKTALVMGTKGYWIIGYGKDPAVAWANLDVVTVVNIEAGYQRKNALGGDEFAELTISQALGVVGTVYEDVVMAT